jgi:hypothetical protein
MGVGVTVGAVLAIAVVTGWLGYRAVRNRQEIATPGSMPVGALPQPMPEPIAPPEPPKEPAVAARPSTAGPAPAAPATASGSVPKPVSAPKPVAAPKATPPKVQRK